MRRHHSLITVATLAVLSSATWAAAWEANLVTHGEDVFWTSPTAVEPTTPHYFLAAEIERVAVEFTYFGFPFEYDVTNEIPPEYLSNQGLYDGPPPIVLIDEPLQYPEPPEPAGVAADLHVALAVDGYAEASATNVVLGTVTVEIPGFGQHTVQIDGIQLTVNLSATPLPLGDVNCDGAVNFADIDPFVLALTDPLTYAQSYPECDSLLGDVNDDGALNFGDIDPFVALLTGG